MKITLIVEGKTEKAFLPYLRNFLEIRLPKRIFTPAVSRRIFRMPQMPNSKCDNGWAMNPDSIRMLHSTILKRGYCLIGPLSRNWRGIKKRRPLESLKPSIIIIHLHIASRKFLRLEGAGTVM